MNHDLILQAFQAVQRTRGEWSQYYFLLQLLSLNIITQRNVHVKVSFQVFCRSEGHEYLQLPIATVIEFTWYTDKLSYLSI